MRYTARLYIPFTVLLMAMTIALPSNEALGEVTEAALLQQLQEARQKGVKLSPEEIQDIITRFRERKERLRKIEEESQVKVGGGAQTQNTPQDLHKILSRVMGQDGIPFPKPEETVLKPAPTMPPATFDSPTPAPLWSPTPQTPPRKCETNEMKREVVYPNADDSDIMRDKLFLPEDLVPLDPEEVFGAKVTLEPYGAALDQDTLDTMRLFKVPCLPYRAIRTQQAEYHLYGSHALRMYTGKPTGKEKPHPFIQEKVKSSPTSRR